MKHPPYPGSSWSEALSLGVLAALSFSLASGCGKSEAASKPLSAPESAPVVPASAAKIDVDHYTAEMAAGGPYTAGNQGSVLVKLTPKAGYHINKQYPYKFKLITPAPDGVTYPKPVLVREDGTFDEMLGTFSVPFLAAKAGKATVAGTLSLSVCSEANCVMEKQDLTLDVDVN